MRACARHSLGSISAEICITSGIRLESSEGPDDAFRLDDVKGVAVVPALAHGRKCARSWKVSTDVGSRSRISGCDVP